MKVVTIRAEKEGELSVDLHAVQMIRATNKSGHIHVEIFLVGRDAPFTIVMLEKDRGVYLAMLQNWIERDKPEQP